MSNRTLYMSILAFAAAGAVSANSSAKAEEAGYASLTQLIHEDLDQNQAEFTATLAKRTGRKINARMAKLDNVFGPLVAAAPEVTAATIRTAAIDASAKLETIVLASADFDIGKDAANIETPFNPRLPMPPAIVAFEGGEF